MKEVKVPTEVYSRCSGYFRPVAQWNKGKQAEFSDRRKMKFDTDEILTPEAELTGVRQTGPYTTGAKSAVITTSWDTPRVELIAIEAIGNVD